MLSLRTVLRRRFRAISFVRCYSLRALEAQVHSDLEKLHNPRENWILRDHETGPTDEVLDVLIVGGGQAGVSASFGLMRERVDRCLVIDREPYGKEGCWATYARMPHLRTTRFLTGLDLGIPSLTYQSYYEALHPENPNCFAQLEAISTSSWNDYLLWFRKVLNLPVVNNVEMTDLSYNAADGNLEVTVKTSEEKAVIRAKKVVLARGRHGSWFMPKEYSEALGDSGCLYHSSDPAVDDIPVVPGVTRVVVVGVGASGLDNACMFAMKGAKTTSLARRQLEANERPNFFAWATNNHGLMKHFGDLGDADRWNLMTEFLCCGEPAPLDTAARAKESGAEFVSGEVRELKHNKGSENPVTLVLNDGRELHCDYVIAATGNTVCDDAESDPALANVWNGALRWREEHVVPDDQIDFLAKRLVEEAPGYGVTKSRALNVIDTLQRQPYLSPNFALLPKSSEHSWLRNVFVYDYLSAASHSMSGLGVSGLRTGLPRLLHGLTESLFKDDLSLHVKSWHHFRDTGEGMERGEPDVFLPDSERFGLANKMDTRLEIDDVNNMTAQTFADTVSPVFNTPLLDFAVESAAAARPFASRSELLGALSAPLLTIDDTDHIDEILGEHDRLGATRVQQVLGPDAAIEQAGAGLTNLSEYEYNRFLTLNEAYEAKFKHPFIVAVANLQKAEILQRIESRIAHDADMERRICLGELIKIARVRLEKLVK